VNRGKRDIVAGVVAKCRVAVGFAIRLSCRGTREIVVRSDCIEDLMCFVVLVVLIGAGQRAIYTLEEGLWKHRMLDYVVAPNHHTMLRDLSRRF